MQTNLAGGLFPLDDPARAWLVEHGFADIFLLERDGPRRHLLRVHAGAAVTGIGVLPDARHTLACLPAPEAILRDAGSLQTLPTPALDRWIDALTLSLTTRRPGRTLYLVPGQLTALDRKPVAPPAEVLWTSPESGSAFFLGDRTLPPILAGQLFPVSNHGWLEPEETTQFAAQATAELRDTADLAAALTPFFACLLTRWEARVETEEASHRLRADRVRKADRIRMREALLQLAAPLRPGGEPLPPTAEDPLLACCQAIGQVERIDFHAPPGGTPPSGIAPVDAIARASKIRTRKVLLASEWWRGDHGALLGRTAAEQSPVALLPAKGGYLCFDPAANATQPVDAARAATLEPFATSFYRALPEEPITGPVLLRFAFADFGPDLRRVLGLSVITAVVTLTLPVLTGQVFDHILPQAQRGQLALVGSLLLVMAVVNTLFNLARGSILLRLEGRIDARLQAALWGRLLDLSPAFSRGFSSGDLASRGLGIQTIREALTGAATSSLLAGVFSLVTFGLLVFYNPELALAAAGMTLAALLLTLGLGLLELRYQRRLAANAGALAGLTLGLVQGIAKIRVAAAEPRAFMIWARSYRQQVANELAGRRVNNWQAAFNAAWLPLCTAFLFALYLLAQKKALLLTPEQAAAQPPMSTGDFVAFLSGFGIMLRSVLTMAAAGMSLLAVAPAYERARPILEALPETGPDRAHPGELSGTFELRDLSFRYQPDSPPVLRNLSLRVQAGEFVAVVGSSGSGKSTLMRLLLGFEQPTGGSVLYDGRDLRTLDLRDLRQQIGVVLQNGRIRAGSIHQNILGAASATIEDAWDAARMAGFAPDIEAMPMGMHTVLGEGGGTLSGGQRQRLLIARALVRQPRLLFFDEATSALDNHTQAIVSRSLDLLDTTRIVIAHRLSTIERADRIVVLQHGEIVEEGTFHDLLNRNGVFTELARRQLI